MGNIWDRTSRFLSGHFSAILPIALAGIFVPMMITQTLEPLGEPGAPEGLIVALSGISLIAALIVLWAQLAIIALVSEPASARHAGMIALRRYPAAIGVSLLILLIFIALAAPIAAMLAASGFWTGAKTGMAAVSPGMLALIVLYAILLVPVLLYLSARLALTMPVVVAERRGAGAIGRSWRLTAGLAAAIIGVFLLYILMLIVAHLAAKTVFGSIMLLLFGHDGTITVAGVLTAIAVALVTTCFTVLQAAFLATLYLASADSSDGVAVPV
ncbi:hypothetical protein FHR23_003020 [Stakelama sediminis]|uniref:Glycerophosphoryl diester phosphodiesterase membrane domain-containing protein n=1 Tax=Stakelama sediminis TaxID=463200 RepID=A0A840Z2U7_9SPHN|nr:hypothetical protein [Stakelama sediminis]MBB5720060.1 hypothetical protein [Stakelama sediminis]